MAVTVYVLALARDLGKFSIGYSSRTLASSYTTYSDLVIIEVFAEVCNADHQSNNIL